MLPVHHSTLWGREGGRGQAGVYIVANKPFYIWGSGDCKKWPINHSTSGVQVTVQSGQ